MADTNMTVDMTGTFNCKESGASRSRKVILQLLESEDQEKVISIKRKDTDASQIMSPSVITVNRYKKGTNVLLHNSFQLLANDDSFAYTLEPVEEDVQDSVQIIKQWVSAIQDYILTCTEQKITILKTQLGLEDLLMMGWTYELLSSSKSTRNWQRKFLVLRKTKLQIYDNEPESIEKWERTEASYDISEMTIRLNKQKELEDLMRPNTIIVQCGTGHQHIFSFEKQRNLQKFMQILEAATIEAVADLKIKQFSAVWNDETVIFQIGLKDGFKILNSLSKEVLWQMPFNRLKISSDDGHTSLHLEFSGHINEVQEIYLQDLQIVLCSIQAFFKAKLAEYNDVL